MLMKTHMMMHLTASPLLSLGRTSTVKHESSENQVIVTSCQCVSDLCFVTVPRCSKQRHLGLCFTPGGRTVSCLQGLLTVTGPSACRVSSAQLIWSQQGDPTGYNTQEWRLFESVRADQVAAQPPVDVRTIMRTRLNQQKGTEQWRVFGSFGYDDRTVGCCRDESLADFRLKKMYRGRESPSYTCFLFCRFCIAETRIWSSCWQQQDIWRTR